MTRPMRSTRRLMQTFVCVSVMLVLTATGAWADSIPELNTEIVVDQLGGVTVTEHLLYDPGDNKHHGLLRDIPTRYTLSDGSVINRPPQISSVTDEAGQAYPFTQTQLEEPGVLEIKIGDPDRTISGTHWYVLTYHLDGVILPASDRPSQALLAWDVIGEDYAPVDKATVTITLPDGTDTPTAACYTGSFGATTGNCTMTVDDRTHVSGELGLVLATHNNWTVNIFFDKQRVTLPGAIELQTTPSQFHPRLTLDGQPVKTGLIALSAGEHTIETHHFKYLPTTTTVTIKPGQTLPVTIPITKTQLAKLIDLYLPPLLLLGGLLSVFLVWWRWGRDPKGRATIIPEYEAPEGLTAAGVGVLIDNSVNKTDLTAILLELAVGGYLNIVVEETKGIKKLFQHDTIRLIKQPKDHTPLLPYQRTLFHALFADQTEEVLLTDLKTTLPKSWPIIKDKLFDELMNKKYYVWRPERAKAATIVAGVLVIAAGILGAGWLESLLDTMIYAVIIVVLGICILLLAPIMPKRTKAGQLAYQHCRGLKQFLSVTESLRLAKTQSPEQFKDDQTVFETFLPYATALGVEKQWTKQFPDLQSPSWYQGHGAFTTALLLSNLSTIHTATASTFGGRSGGVGGSGGFAGGGFGGGGAGGW